MQLLRFRKILFLLIETFFLAGCSFAEPLPTVTVTPTITSLPTQTPTPKSSDWRQLQPGLERRVLEIDIEGQFTEPLYILRLSPEYFQFGVAYDPEGLTLEAWQAQSGALIVVNGGYYRLDNDIFIPTGLTIIAGVPMGTSYGDFGGMFAINENGPKLRWLAQQPYDPNEVLHSALQSFPILVKPGGELGFPAVNEDNLMARRTVIAQDQSGNILLMVAPQGNLTLHQLSAFLTNTDLDLDIAVNLDGGAI